VDRHQHEAADADASGVRDADPAVAQGADGDRRRERADAAVNRNFSLSTTTPPRSAGSRWPPEL